MITEAAIMCLALNIYHEARGEPVEGQIAVALVTYNRAIYDSRRNARNVADSICPVVYQPRQFSWTSRPTEVTDQGAWRTAIMSARHALRLRDFTGGANHFHATHTTPYWAASMMYVGRWGNHYFYRR